MSEKNQKTAEDGTEETPMSGDERISKMADQTDISRSNEKESNLQAEKQSNQLERSTTIRLQEGEPNAPPTEEPDAQDTLVSGPPQKQGSEEPPSQNGGLLLNQEAESKETQVASPRTQVTDDSTSPKNQESESSETQESKEQQAHNPSEAQLEGNSSPIRTQQENLTATKEPYQTKKEAIDPRERETDQARIEDPTHNEESVLQHIEETDRQEDEIKDNNHTDGFQLKSNAGTAEEEAAPVSDDKQDSKDSVDDPKQNDLEESKEQNSTEDIHADPSNTNPEEAGHDISKVSSHPDSPVIERELEIQETLNDKATKGEKIETLISGSSSPTSDEPTPGLLNDQTGDTSNTPNPEFELQDNKPEKGSLDEMDSTSTEPTEATEQEGTELKDSHEHAKSRGQVVFIETPDQLAIKDLLRNCRMYQEEFKLDGDLEGAVKEYEYLLKKEKETGCKKQKSAPPPSELSFVNDKERSQAPLLYAVIADVSEKVPNYNRWREAVSEFISLTTISQPEPQTSKNKKDKSQSGKQHEPKVSTIKPMKQMKSYRNNIEKLLDQEWGLDCAPGLNVHHDYRHLFTCESVLRSTFPEADIFNLVDSTIRGPEDVPPELRHKALFHFLLSINPKKYGVNPSDAWRDFGRLVLAEKQLELAKKAQGPDLHQNIIVKRLDFYKMQNELKEKTEEVEELSTRLSKFASQQLTEGNPNIADLSDTHRPTRLGEMYSQLFDDEWSEAFEAFKPKTEDEDDDIFPDTLYILQDLLTRIFEFCKDQSKSQKTYIEDSFALAIGLTEPKIFKKEDAVTAIECKDAPKLDEKEQAGSLGDTSSFTDKINEEEQVKESQKDTDGKGESSEQLSTQRAKEDENVEKESSNKLEPNKSGEELSTDTNTNNMQETPSNGTPIDGGGESSETSETDKGNTIPATDKGNTIPATDMAENGKDKHGEDVKQDRTSSEQKESEGTDVNRNNGNNRNNNEEQGIQINEQEDHNQQTSKETVGEVTEPSNQTTNAKSPEKLEEGKEDTEKSDSSQKDQAQVSGGEDKMSESKDYRKNIVYPTIERHARDFRKAAASTSAKTKSKLFIATGLPALIPDETVRADVRVLTYVRKCVELCWYMCMQDPPMVIVSPKRGQLVDKALFSFHGRRGKIVEVCVWPALLLHEGGPLVCKGYVLPEERNRNR